MLLRHLSLEFKTSYMVKAIADGISDVVIKITVMVILSNTEDVKRISQDQSTIPTNIALIVNEWVIISLNVETTLNKKDKEVTTMSMAMTETKMDLKAHHLTLKQRHINQVSLVHILILQMSLTLSP